LSNFTGNLNELEKSNRFVKKLMGIPRCKERINFVEFMMKYPTSVIIVNQVKYKIYKRCIT